MDLNKDRNIDRDLKIDRDRFIDIDRNIDRYIDRNIDRYIDRNRFRKKYNSLVKRTNYLNSNAQLSINLLAQAKRTNCKKHKNLRYLFIYPFL